MTGQEIRERRTQMGLTQAQMGAALGVAANTIARWERNEFAPDNPRMLELALDQLAFQRASELKGPTGRAIKQRLKKLAEIRDELQRLVAES